MNIGQCAIGIGTYRVYFDDRTASSGQHHHAHDALGVDALRTLGDENVAYEATGHLGQLGSGPGMLTEFIGNGDVLTGHPASSAL